MFLQVGVPLGTGLRIWDDLPKIAGNESNPRFSASGHRHAVDVATL
jgi:hypothetical protein